MSEVRSHQATWSRLPKFTAIAQETGLWVCEPAVRTRTQTQLENGIGVEADWSTYNLLVGRKYQRLLLLLMNSLRTFRFSRNPFFRDWFMTMGRIFCGYNSVFEWDCALQHHVLRHPLLVMTHLDWSSFEVVLDIWLASSEKGAIFYLPVAASACLLCALNV